MHPNERILIERVSGAWCRRRDSNPHGFLRTILSRVRIPIPPLRQLLNFSALASSKKLCLVAARVTFVTREKLRLLTFRPLRQLLRYNLS